MQQDRTGRTTRTSGPTGPSAAAANVRPFRSQPDEALRRARRTTKRTAPTPAATQTRHLAESLEAFLRAGLPHIDDALTAPVAQLTLTVPGGRDVLTAQLPEELADTLIQALRAVTAALPEPAPRHERTVDTAPRGLRLVTGGSTR